VSVIHCFKMLCLYIVGQHCLHLTHLPFSSSETYSSKYEKLLNIVIYACEVSTEINEFVENVWPANSALFIYVSTHCVETVKKLYYKRHSQLTRWCSGNASVLGARGPWFNSRLQQRVLCLIWFFCCCCVFYLLSKKALF